MFDAFLKPDITEVLPGVFLGEEEDATNWSESYEIGVTHGIVCVHEDRRLVVEGAHHVPILEWVGDGFLDAVAHRDMLDAATSIMRSYQRRGLPVLVHCAAGVERSPLTMAWFLRRYGHTKTIPQAYAFIQAYRPIVADRLEWLNPKKPSSPTPQGDS